MPSRELTDLDAPPAPVPRPPHEAIALEASREAIAPEASRQAIAPSREAIRPEAGEGGRAPRMSPDERREMLITATLPLVARYGLKVTTRQIAEAAGVAEGTIFRVFPDKEALIRATVAKALDPEPVMTELTAVDMRLELHDKLVVVTDILQRRFIKVFNMMLAVGMHGPPKDVDEHRRAARPQHEAILLEINRILEPDEGKLRCPVPEVVRILRLLTFSGSHPLISDGRLLSADEIADVLLHGTLKHDAYGHGTHGHQTHGHGTHGHIHTHDTERHDKGEPTC